MLLYLLYAVFILSCIVLILAVLLQPGKADAGALFTSSVSSAAFGPRGTQTLLAKITIGAAITFMLVALALALNVGRQGSVMESLTDPAEQAQPAVSPAAPAEGAASPAGEQPAGGQQPAPADANTNGNANTNTNTNTNANASESPAANASPQGAASPGQ
ncbi:MAG TPA: preprotein translocase subunit SecG [Pyrinomonadaceae bacterium]|nr:preprotein translocase subunit SecG [Pyrinomonadaceae bacterium]